MKPPDRRLLREIVVVLALKFVLLALLWHAFVRDQRVDVDAAAFAQRIAPAAAAPGSASSNSTNAAFNHDQ